MTEATDDLPKARTLDAEAPITIEDGGPGGELTVGINPATSSELGVVRLSGQLGGNANAPDVRGIRIPSEGIEDGEDAQTLAFVHIANGEVLVRSGSTVAGLPVLGLGGGVMTGNINMGSHKITGLADGEDPGDAVNYGQLAGLLSGLEWQDSVLDNELATPPGSPTAGDRYIVPEGGTDAWDGKDGQIAIWGTVSWAFLVPTTGMTVHVDENGRDYHWNGTAWVNLGASVDHNSLINLTTDDPHTQYQLRGEKDEDDGFAGVDSDGNVSLPVKAIRVLGSDPGSPASGEVWVKGAELSYRDAASPSVTQVVEHLTRRNANNGYAGLDSSGRIDAAQAPLKSTYATGGGQALTPSDIGGVGTSRSIATGTGLSGGGNLSADRTISIASFTGIVSQDFDPASTTWSASEVKVHLTLDIGPAGMLVPVAVRLPAVSSTLQTEVVFKFEDNTTATLMNTGGAPLDETMANLSTFLMADLGSVAANNGKRLQQIIFQTRNNNGAGSAGPIDLGSFKIRAWAFPRGGGSAL